MTQRQQSHAVVTGASAGVGRAVALRLAREGLAVGLIARDEAALDAVAAEIEDAGGRAMVLPCDVSDAAAVEAAAQRTVEANGPIDVWVNDAMAAVFGTLDQITPEEFRRVTEVTYLGFVHGTMSALRHMNAQDSGVVVQIGSALAYRGIPLQAAYCGAKHAIRGFTASVRAELAAEGSRIQITSLHLPAVNTPQFDWARTHREHAPRPAGAVYQPEAIAEAVMRAVRRPAREYWLGRQGPLLIVANQIVPGFLDRKMSSAIRSQTTDEKVAPDRPDNLFEPVHDLHRTRGRFSLEARDSVPTFDARLVRFGGLAAFALLAGALGAVLTAWLT